MPGVVSQAVFDSERGLLYAVDSGNNRIVALNPAAGSDGGPIEPNYDGTVQRYVNGGSLTTLVDGAAVGLVTPAGLDLHQGVLYVTDNATGKVHGFSRDGDWLDWVDLNLPSGSLNGIAIDSSGKLFVVDSKTNEVLRLSQP